MHLLNGRLKTVRTLKREKMTIRFDAFSINKAKHTAKAIHIFWIGYYAKANMCHPAFSKETKKEMNVSKLVGEIFRGRLSLVS